MVTRGGMLGVNRRSKAFTGTRGGGKKKGEGGVGSKGRGGNGKKMQGVLYSGKGEAGNGGEGSHSLSKKCAEDEAKQGSEGSGSVVRGESFRAQGGETETLSA